MTNYNAKTSLRLPQKATLCYNNASCMRKQKMR